jgi:hypothetical protein
MFVNELKKTATFAFTVHAGYKEYATFKINDTGDIEIKVFLQATLCSW